ncbi:F420-dependent methylene-tetrahydromethanopterin reductase [Mycolicibacillus koreensis]|nr:F420-dependent methylene-tetrahydromethanopterin reductase [Mycolicibacillus koreensis]
MRVATTVEASGFDDDPIQVIDFVVEAEKLGLDLCFVAEAWGSDAPSALGYLAARTERLILGSGVLQIGTRTPVAIAQAAITLSNLSQGRFVLGLGTSGPRVIEGLHGVAFAHPLTRLRENIDIIRAAFAGEKIAYDGTCYTLPRPGGEGTPMRLSTRPQHPIPLYLAAMSPGLLRLTGETADGWLGTSFVPEGAVHAYFAHLDEGLADAGRTRADLDICQGAEVAFADDEDALARLVDARRGELAFSLGGMGSVNTNFYNRAYARQGWSAVAEEIKRLWQDGDRAAATALVSDQMVLATTLIGTEEMVRDRLTVWRDAGVNTVRLYPAGQTLADKLDTLGRAIALVREVSAPR